MTKVYIGDKQADEVFIDTGKRVYPLPERGHLAGIGFSWGYDGTGPFHLAKALVADAAGIHSDRVADKVHDNITSWLPFGGWQMEAADLKAWVLANPPSALPEIEYEPELSYGAERPVCPVEPFWKPWQRSACCLYRCFSESGELLYVGISEHGLKRFSQHRKTKSWWGQVSGVQVAHFGTRQEALEAESAAIVTEGPRYNIAGRVR